MSTGGGAPVDVVIPAHEKDREVLQHCVRAALRHLVPVRHVHVVSRVRLARTRDERVRWVPEPTLPTFPSADEIRGEFAGPPQRAGWIYQQLLKLAAPEFIPGLAERFLVLDADVVFLRRVSWDDATGRFPYSRASEHHPPYEAAYRRLVGEEPPTGQSLVAHHMLFERAFVAELLDAIENFTARPWRSAILEACTGEEASMFSEWNLYGWWVLRHRPEASVHRQLHWRDVRTVPGLAGRAVIGLDYDFVAAHRYLRAGRPARARSATARILGELVAPLRR